MRQASLSFIVGLMALILVGCSQSTIIPQSASSTPEVTLSITDEPPSGVTVLFFQINLTAAYLTPASGGSTVSLLNNSTPVQIDVTELQAISAFLSTTNVTAGTYNSLTLTFASPQLVIFNESNTSIASSCAVGNVCQLTPQIDDNSGTVTLSSAPFPLTVSGSTPIGLLLDFHLNNVIQSDLSVNLGVSNGVTVKTLPAAPANGYPPFGFVRGTVQTVVASQNQFTIQTRDGRTFTIDVNSSTTYANFPSSVCTTNGFSCLAPQQVVKVQVANVEGPGTLLAGEVDYIQQATQQAVEGDIIGLSASGGSTMMTLLLHWSPNNTALPCGGVATVTVPSTATYSIDAGSFTMPSGLSFASAIDLLVGQDVQVAVASGSLTAASQVAQWSPPTVSFTASSVELEPSQITGTVTALGSNGTSFTISTFPNFFLAWTSKNWTPQQVTVDTTTQTTYMGLNPDSFAGVSVNSTVSVRGWLFATPSGSTASTQVAQFVVGRANGFF